MTEFSISNTSPYILLLYFREFSYIMARTSYIWWNDDDDDDDDFRLVLVRSTRLAGFL
jgi:hypothetical protein